MISINIENEYISLKSEEEIPKEIIRELDIRKNDNFMGIFYNIPFTVKNAFIVFCVTKKFPKKVEVTEETLSKLKDKFKGYSLPKATVYRDEQILVEVPDIDTYKNFLERIGAKRYMMGKWTVSPSKVYEAYGLIKAFSHPFLPKIKIEEELEDLMSLPISDKNRMNDLFSIELEDLLTVKNGWQVKMEGFDKLKYFSAADLLLRRPRYYIDRTELHTFREAPFGKPIRIKGRVLRFSAGFNGSSYMDLIDEDGKEIEVSFFGFGYMAGMFQKGDVVYVEGSKFRKSTKVGPKTVLNGTGIITEEQFKTLPVAPVYRQSPSSKITSRLLISSVQELLKRFDGSKLSNYIEGTSEPLWSLLKKLHFPENIDEYYNTLDNLAYIELVYLQLLFLHKRLTEIKAAGVPKIVKKPKMMEEAINNLPYKLTNGQKNAITHIIEKMNTEQSENIMLSGDVGSGKTLVAQSACLYNVEAGYQAVLVGPTEILARQLYDTFIKFIDPLKKKPNIAYLSGNTKAKERKEIEKGLKDGSIDILVGTHGVFNVEYKNLGLIIIDEQQKFGARQRESLLHSRSDGRLPDLLSQTATPIPRSTALAFYGDIDLIPLSEKPGNRKENITKWIQMSSEQFLENTKSKEWEHIFSEIENGRQIFVVTPAVDESAKTASVKSVYSILEKKYKNIKIDFVHGQMSKDSQNKVIEKFRSGNIQVLVASSIVEVGVDIPNATVMLVLDADRFGASSLHQIRGRVGRSEHQGYCYLVSLGKTENSKKRLNSLVQSNDGFQIALVDLETRKEGSLFGIRQSGESSLRFCDLANHASMIEEARAEAERIYNSKSKTKALSDARVFIQIEE